jgi:predicted type IV restriction endonuclease
MILKEDLQFHNDLQTLSQKIQERKIHITNEETTKTALIIPFIQILGYDVSNPLEVQTEFVAAWGEKKDQRVDYALFKNKDKDKNPIIFIEAKPVNENLANYDAQLAQYFNAYSDTKVAILTNGEEYRFFTDNQKPNVMDKSPFLIVNFSKLKESDCINLTEFKKENYDQESLCSFAEDLYYTTAITETFKGLIKKPTVDFIDFLFHSSVPGKVLTTKIREKLPPIVKQAIQNSISEMTRLGIEDQQKEAQIIQRPKPNEIKKEKKSQTPPVETKPNAPPTTIETTEEEKKSFEIVKSILQKAGRDVSNLKYKDTSSYFSINNRNTYGWFLRLFLKETMKKIDVSIDIPNIESLTKGFEIKKYPNSGVTNIIIHSIDDLKKLDKLIITCFDEVNK